MLNYQFPCKLPIKQVFYSLSGGREEGKPKTLQYFIKGVSNALPKPQYTLASITRKRNTSHVPQMSLHSHSKCTFHYYREMIPLCWKLNLASPLSVS